MAKTITYSGSINFSNGLKVGSSTIVDLPADVLAINKNTDGIVDVSLQTIYSLIDAFGTIHENICLQLNQFKREKAETETQTAEEASADAIGDMATLVLSILSGNPIAIVLAAIGAAADTAKNNVAACTDSDADKEVMNSLID